MAKAKGSPDNTAITSTLMNITGRHIGEVNETRSLASQAFKIEARNRQRIIRLIENKLLELNNVVSDFIDMIRTALSKLLRTIVGAAAYKPSFP